MISLTKLLLGKENYGDSLRYKKDSSQQFHGTSKVMDLVVDGCYKIM